MKATEYLANEVKNLLRTLVCRNTDYAVDQALKILKDEYGAEFYRVNDWPEDLKHKKSNFIIVHSRDDVEVSITGSCATILLARGCEE